MIQAGLLERETINLQMSTDEQLHQLDQKNMKMIEYFNKDMMMGLPHSFFDHNSSFLESSFQKKSKLMSSVNQSLMETTRTNEVKRVH